MVIALDRLVAKLPEVYQPIFGHPELSQRISRGSEDRLQSIVKIYRDLEAQLDRPLRVLDLGCAQGFFCLSLAKLGAITHGIDFQYCNIAVCKALARESPELEASFEAVRIEDVLNRLEQDQYDLVLGLSVFHHIIHEIGATSVQGMLTKLSEKITAGVFELALANEPPAWAASQPERPQQILAGFGFVRRIAQSRTHLSAIARPLYFASSRYWRLNGQMHAFEHWTSSSHAYENGAKFGTRRYFFGDGLFAKLVQMDPERSPFNSEDHQNEVAFLSTPPAGFTAPKLFGHGCNEREMWVVREQLPGTLLIDLMRSGEPYDAKSILQDVVIQLAALEAAGLYHDDVRTWNVLIGPDGRATLIDYGAISRRNKDCAWPHNIFLSFIIFAHETVSGKVEDPSLLRSAKLTPIGLPEPYRSALWKLLELPVKSWRFARLRDSILEVQNSPETSPGGAHVGLTMALEAMEEACSLYRATTDEWRQRLAKTEAGLLELQSFVQRAMQQTGS
jgi:O-antigen chain-terminating bifunctional methyltransferase/kinase